MPKRELMEALRHVLESGRAKIAGAAGQMEMLRKELAGMERREVVGHRRYLGEAERY